MHGAANCLGVRVSLPVVHCTKEASTIQRRRKERHWNRKGCRAAWNAPAVRVHPFTTGWSFLESKDVAKTLREARGEMIVA